MLSPLEKLLTRPFPAQLKALFKVEVKSYCLSSEYCYDQVRALSHSYSQMTKSLVHLTHPWRYSDIQCSQRFEANPYVLPVDNLLGNAFGCANGILLL